MTSFKRLYSFCLIVVLHSTITKSQKLSVKSSGKNEIDVSDEVNGSGRTFGVLRPLIGLGLTQALKSNYLLENYYNTAVLPIPTNFQSYPFHNGLQNSYNQYYGTPTANGYYPFLSGSTFGLPAPVYNVRPIYGAGLYGANYGNSPLPYINKPTSATTNQNFGASATANVAGSNYGINTGNLHNNNNNAQLLQLANLLGQVLGQQLRPYINGENSSGSPIIYTRRNS